MKVEEHQEREMEIEGWPVHLTSYRIGETFHCTADNVSPGANSRPHHVARRARKPNPRRSSVPPNA